MVLPPEYGPENLGENNPLALASAIVDPSYIGWWAAASFHGFTTQKPMAIAVGTTRQRGTRTLEGREVRFVKLAPYKFFGFKPYDVHARRAILSTPAKTLADCADRPDLAGGPAELSGIMFGASATVDPEELGRVALQMQSTALLQRLGFLTDLTGWRWPQNIRHQVRTAIPKSARSTFGRADRQPGNDLSTRKIVGSKIQSTYSTTSLGVRVSDTDSQLPLAETHLRIRKTASVTNIP